MSGFRLEQCVALITGAAGGIGYAVAKRFAQAGAIVALADLDRTAVEEAAVRLSALGYRASGFVADVSRPDEVAALVRDVLTAFAHIDVLVNNAGVMGRTAPLAELTDEDWRHVIDVDLTSVFFVSRAVVPHMRARKRGCIISVASIAGKEGTPNLIPYSAAKGGIIAFTKALGKEVVADGIRVNCVAPGVVATPLLDQLPPEATQVMLSKVPMGRLGTADEVAAVIHFLASDAASFVTAQCYDASGGRATY